jgi:deoxyribodipyrimidine photolyase-related protein
MQAFLLFPHQLFEDITPLEDSSLVVLTEEFLYFRQYAFHRQKLAYHRASMQHYLQFLTKKGIEVQYVESQSAESDVRKLIPKLKASGIDKIVAYFPDDDWLQKRIETTCKAHNLSCCFVSHHGFINDEKTLLFPRKDGRFLQTDWYVQQRKKLNILMQGEKPFGGQWTFDADNRLRYPAGKTPPIVEPSSQNNFTKEAIDYITQHFPHNPGSLENGVLYPIHHEGARQWLQDFLQKRFAEFGPYEDAIVQREHWLHHSVLTPMLNTGLLTPAIVVDETLDFARKNNVPLSSLEGFIRQMVGWREFMRLFYLQHGVSQRTANFWGFNRKIPSSFYNGTTGIAPVDNCIQKLLRTGYNHHIERLMVLGNFMLLCEFDPNEVYRWFMEMYIDAYDWVMVPNVYGMSQFADGGKMTTKPYISGSNYLLKMSDYKPDGKWEKIWDALFWSFMHKQREFFGQNPRIGMLLKTLDRMPPEKRDGYFKLANDYLMGLE